MRRTGIYILVLLVMVALLGSLSIACTCSKGQPTGTNQPGTQTTGGGGTTPTGTSAAATSTSAPIPGMPDIADTKSLSSYRLSIMSKLRLTSSAVQCYCPRRVPYTSTRTIVQEVREWHMYLWLEGLLRLPVVSWRQCASSRNRLKSEGG